MNSQRPKNWVLASLLQEAGLSHSALARQINHAALSQHRLATRYDASSVHRWLRGAIPEAPVPALIAELLSRKLQRQITTDELLGSATDALIFPDTAAQAVEQATALWRDTVHRRDLLAYPFAAAASLDAGWRWAFGSATANLTSTGSIFVGMADVERLVGARADFAGLDRAHGGGHARVWLADFLDREATPLLHGTYTDKVGRALFSAVALLTETVAYMAFDDHDHAAAQRAYIQSLGLAKHAGDTAFGSYILSNMGAQYVLLNEGARGAELARAGWSRAPRGASPTLLARLHTTEARGHAAVGDVTECRRSLRQADQALARSRPADDPAWVAAGASSPAHHAGSTMHCLADLGLFKEAAKYAALSLDLPADNIRAKALHQVVHARVLAGLGEIEHSVDIARTALHTAGRLRSRRLLGRVRQYHDELRAVGNVRAVREWQDEARPILAAA